MAEVPKQARTAIERTIGSPGASSLGGGRQRGRYVLDTVEPGNWVCCEAARDSKNGRKLQSGKQAHQRPWTCILRLRLVGR